MKRESKDNLLKVLFLMFIGIVILSFIIPTGTFNETYVVSETNPVGIINIFRMPVITFAKFIQYTLLFASIGILYGVINKIGVYDKLIDSIVKKWKGKETKLVIIITVLFALIGSLTGISVIAILLLPFIAAILMSLKVDKLTVLLSTIGAYLVGSVASIFGYTNAGYMINILNITMTKEIVTKIILFIILIGLYVFYILKITKKEKYKDEEIPLYEKTKSKERSVVPFIVLSIIFLIIIFIGSYNWYYTFGIELFQNLDTKLQGMKLLSNILNGISILGYWNNYEAVVAILIYTVLLSWIYNLKINDIIDGSINGIKKLSKVIIYATICNIIFTVMLMDTNNMYATIVNYIVGIKSTFSIPIISIISFIGSIFYNDFYYMLMNLSTTFASYEAVYYPIIGVLVNGIYSLMMMILPTSILLVASLTYFNIPYQTWLKNIWKYILEALIILLLVVIIVVVLI